MDDERPTDEDSREPYCTTCGAAVGIFVGRGNDWLHYTGRPETANVLPYVTDHEPAIEWRAQAGPAALVAVRPRGTRDLPA